MGVPKDGTPPRCITCRMTMPKSARSLGAVLSKQGNLLNVSARSSKKFWTS
jgi:hypothetical protein